MEANLPTTPGPYWFREKNGDEWRAIILTHVDIEAIQEDIPEFGEAYIDGMTISGGQWAKAHSPDEGIEAWAVKNRNGKLDVCWFDEQHTSLFVDQINEIPPGGNKVVPVTIYKREVGA